MTLDDRWLPATVTTAYDGESPGVVKLDAPGGFFEFGPGLLCRNMTTPDRVQVGARVWRRERDGAISWCEPRPR